MLARSLLRFFFGTVALSAALAQAAPTLQAPATAKVASEVTFTVAGAGNPRDFVTIVPKAQKEGSYLGYVYVEKGGALKLVMPAAAGDYELRLLSANSPLSDTRSKRDQAGGRVGDARLSCAGRGWRESFQVKWTGPKNARDFIGIGDAEQKYGTYHYVNEGSTLTFQAPDAPGTYQVRYFLAVDDTRHRGKAADGWVCLRFRRLRPPP